jgi:[acyl-carrier-protein] S-malonyltransferase
MGRAFMDASSTMGELFSMANTLLGYDLQSICLGGPGERLREPEVCQPALFVVGYGAFCTLRELDLIGDLRVCGGFSLGEWTALAAAEAISFEDGLLAVAARARFMAEAGEKTPGAMAAIIGADADDVERLCEACSIFKANINSPDQIVVAGEVEKIHEAIARAAEFGARRAIPLNVAGAYHCPVMKLAGERFAQHLARVQIVKPRVPVLSNVSGLAVDDEKMLRQLLIEQITSPVQWIKCLHTAEELGAKKFMECGAGRVLQGLVRKNLPEAVAISAEDLIQVPAE